MKAICLVDSDSQLQKWKKTMCKKFARRLNMYKIIVSEFK